MPKQRAPISTRLRNKDKSGTKTLLVQEKSSDNTKKKVIDYTTNNPSEDNTIFSPRADTNIYLDELQSPLSFVRGTDEEKAQFLKDEDEAMSQSFGSDYKSSLKTSSFYYARISAPIPSKRSKDRNSPSSLSKRPLSIRDSMNKIKLPFLVETQKSKLQSPSPSTSLEAYTCTSTTTKSTPTPKTKTTVSSTTSSTSKLPSNINNQRTISREKETRLKNAINGRKQIDTEIETHSVEAAPAVPLPQCKKLPVYIKMDAKDKEREYWRRQRRTFVHSRFLTNEEGVAVAKTVYSNLSINPTNRMVISMQGNIANFRTKLRRIFISQAKRFNISMEYIANTKEDQMIHELTLKMNDNILRSIWEHWIADPFVDAEEFYLDEVSVNLLRNITVKLMIIHFKEQFSFLSPKQARTEMRKLDLISRTIILPESSEFV